MILLGVTIIWNCWIYERS